MPEPVILYGVPVYVRHDVAPVEAIGLLDGRVAAVGPLAQVRDALPAGATLRLLDRGAVMPAFVDPHQHAYLVSADPGADVLYRRAADVRGLVDEIARRVAEAGSPAAPRTWSRYHGYEPLRLAERRSPTARELDRALADRPLHVLSRTFHESVVNAAGLDALGIGRRTPDPAGGKIVRDRRGLPTGVLLEAASFEAEAASRPAGDGTEGAWRERLREHGRRLLANGITRIGDAAVPVEAAGVLVAELAALGITVHPMLIRSRIDAPALTAGGTAKVLLDGGEACHLRLTGRQVAQVFRSSFRSNIGPERDIARAVGMRAGFPHREPDGLWHTGIRFPQEAGFPALLKAAADAGSGLAVHAVGNGAVDAVLRAVAADPGLAAAVRIRIEHAIAIDSSHAARLAKVGIPVVVQPGFISAAGHELNLVPMPMPLRLMPFRTMLAAGVRTAFSSDFPGTDLSPWGALQDAVTRLDAAGAPIDAPEAVDTSVALDAFTRGGAAVLGAEAEAGTLEPGRRADLIWVDCDPRAVPGTALRDTATLATWSEGRMVYQRA